jgi:hypothetical protein
MLGPPAGHPRRQHSIDPLLLDRGNDGFPPCIPFQGNTVGKDPEALDRIDPAPLQPFRKLAFEHPLDRLVLHDGDDKDALRMPRVGLVLPYLLDLQGRAAGQGRQHCRKQERPTNEAASTG